MKHNHGTSLVMLEAKETCLLSSYLRKTGKRTAWPFKGWRLKFRSRDFNVNQNHKKRKASTFLYYYSALLEQILGQTSENFTNKTAIFLHLVHINCTSSTILKWKICLPDKGKLIPLHQNQLPAHFTAEGCFTPEGPKSGGLSRVTPRSSMQRLFRPLSRNLGFWFSDNCLIHWYCHL